jgi:hypothetical protein
MKRTRILICLRIVVVVLVLAAPALARPQAALAGFTWDDNAVTSTDVTPGTDGWTWDDGTDAAETQPSQ